jgi:hypothetical protein
MTLERSRGGPRGLREGGPSCLLCDRPSGRTRDSSPRQLPTDHDHDGGLQARSANIRLINRRPSPPRPAPSPLPQYTPGGQDRSS